MPTFDAAAKQYLAALQARRFSPHTISDYRTTYKKFSQFLPAETELDAIGPDMVIRYFGSPSVLSVSAKTALNYHTGLSSLWRWAVEKGICQANIIRGVKPPKPERRDIIPFNRGEVVAMLAAARSGRHPIRDEAILLLLLDTGMRASELCGVRIGDISATNRQILVMGKGSKERRVKISSRTLEAVRDYLLTRDLKLGTGTRRAPLLLSSQRHQLSRDALRQILERMGDRGEVAHVHAHRFRHTFAISYLRNGGNIYSLQQLLGHTTLDMVKRYLAIAQADLDRDHDRASPVTNWML